MVRATGDLRWNLEAAHWTGRMPFCGTTALFRRTDADTMNHDSQSRIFFVALALRPRQSHGRRRRTHLPRR